MFSPVQRIMFTVCALGAVSSVAAQANQVLPKAEAAIVDASGKTIGTAQFLGSSGGGVHIHVDVMGLPPGHHGMHVHSAGSCADTQTDTGETVPFGAAGPHFDPETTQSHKGPLGGGHAGDLPNLNVDAAGNAHAAFYTQDLTVTGPHGVAGRAIIIHANPDNYTDDPPLGGSGPRIACGIITAD